MVTFFSGTKKLVLMLQSFEEAKSAMLNVKPVMLVSDESCSCWYSELKNGGAVIPSLMWHVFLVSSSVIEAPNSMSTNDLLL